MVSANMTPVTSHESLTKQQQSLLFSVQHSRLIQKSKPYMEVKAIILYVIQTGTHPKHKAPSPKPTAVVPVPASTTIFKVLSFPNKWFWDKYCTRRIIPMERKNHN